MEKFDVVVIGGGLNGLVAALALAGGGGLKKLKVAVIDKFDPHRLVDAVHDSRASAITAATQVMLRTLGVWQGLEPHAQDMKKIVVSDGGDPLRRPALLTFLEPEPGATAALIENRFIFEGVLRALDQQQSIQMIFGTTVRSFQFSPGLAKLTLADEKLLAANLVVGADGRQSAARQAAGIELQGWDYPQSAITLTVAHNLPHDGLAEEHFTPTGVFAVLPLVGHRSSIVWTLPHAEAQRVAALPDGEFLQLLEIQFAGRRGRLALEGARHVFALSMKIADKLAAARLALVGDAGHVLHPLAGLGLNLGFKDVAALADCIADGLALGQDIGGEVVLENYQRARRFDTVATAYAIDGLNRLFANDHAGLKALRDLGLRMVDHSAFAKNLLMKHAAGQSPTLLRLMRGIHP